MENFSSGISNQRQHLALRVALDTMKDRCILQQKRLSEVEDENQQLRESLEQNTKLNGNTSHNVSGVGEIFQLRLQVSELQRKNLQLDEHIKMVSTENRKLWQRLSQIAKEQSKSVKEKDTTLTNVSADSTTQDVTSPRCAAGNQNLIRSKTFTQHSPNPNLRHKLLSADNEMLEFASIDTDAEFEILGDEGAKQQSGVDNESSASQVAMRFGYLNVDDASSNNSSQEQDFNIESSKCMEVLQKMRSEAMQQQQELHSVFALFENRIALHPCPECVKKSKKPEMADKSLETDDSLNDATKYNNTNDLDVVNTGSSTKLVPGVQNNHLNIIQEKLLADDTNNMCPMCGKIYGSQVAFESFCAHVEEHFQDDNLQDIEYNFELISHTVGDF